MPVSRRGIPPASTAPPDRLRPYVFHGLALGAAGGSHALADCPFCGREGKFSIERATGLWRCWVCGAGTERGGGDGRVFTRLLYNRAAQSIVGDSRGISGAFHAAVAADRRLLYPATAAAWGICPSTIDGRTWLVPGYGSDADGRPRLDQVYRRVRVVGSVWRLLPTPGIWDEGRAHALHLPASDFDPARPNIVVCEGPWDGMALWEVWDRGNHEGPWSGGDTNIVAVPGCSVWRDEWTEMCRGKCVTLMYDSDHPRRSIPGSDYVSRAGYDGMVRVAKRLSGVASSVRWLRWGPEGYDAEKPSGWDLRDYLTSASTGGQAS
jgi:hypothetical protein